MAKLSKVVNPKDCIFCKKIASDRISFGPLLLKALYTKYSSSQNYYYSRDINDLLDDRATPAVALFRDLEQYIEDEEYLKRWYHRREIAAKSTQLTEYYKYHRDIPRLFMAGVCITIHRFHDKRRRLEYGKIKHQLGIQNDDKVQSESTHPHYKKGDNNSRDCSVKQLQCMLKGVDLSIKRTEQQSCTTMLRDLLNSIIKKSNMNESFDRSTAFVLNESLFLEPKRKTQNPKSTKPPPSKQPSIPTINIDVINKQFSSNPSSPQRSPQSNPKLQLKLVLPQSLHPESRNTSRSKQSQPLMHDLQKNMRTTNPNIKFSGAQTTRESTHNPKPSLKIPQATSRQTNQQYPTFNQPVRIQKLMAPIVQRQLAQQLIELSNRAKLITMKADQLSPRLVPKHQKTPSAAQNAHFVQPVFQSIPLTSRGTKHPTQVAIMGCIIQNFSLRTQHQAQSQPASPSRPPSQKKINADLSIKCNGSKLSDPKKRVPSVYTINQNNIVNIYLDEKIKSGLLSSRGSSPVKPPNRKILDCENPFKQQFQQVQVNFRKQMP